MDYYVIVGQRIKELREKLNMTRAQLADGICSISYISRIENGTRCPNSLILRQFANKLGISADILLRSVESNTSMMAYELIKKASVHMEYNHYEAVKKLVSKINIDKVESLQDRQIILSLDCIAEGIINRNPLSSLEKVDQLLDMTYKSGATPNNVEFSLLLAKVHNYILLSKFDLAEEIVNFLCKKSKEIAFYISEQPHIRLFIAQSVLLYHQKEFKAAHKSITKAILMAKNNCYHGSLIEAYYIRARIYEAQEQLNKAKHWHEHSELLINLLTNDESEAYILNVVHYIDLDN